MNQTPGIQIDNLHFEYESKGFHLSIPSLQVKQGERVAVVGPSGSGKTTLLRLMAGIQKPNAGAIAISGMNVEHFSESQSRDFRIANIGFVFQNFELLDYLNVLDNVLLPCRINSKVKLTPELRARAVELLGRVGLGDKATRSVLKLSQGEKQRVAICRALLTKPPVVFADEPTGNLDPKNKKVILELLFQQAEDFQATLVVVTHDQSLLDGFHRVIDFGDFQK